MGDEGGGGRDGAGREVRLLDRERLRAWVDRGILTAERAEALWAELEEAGALPAGEPRETPARGGTSRFEAVAYLLGGLVILAALGWLLNVSWLAFGGWGLFAIGLLYLSGFWAAGDRLVRRSTRLGGCVFLTLAGALVPFVVWAFQYATGLWAGEYPGFYRDYYHWIRSGWLPLEIAAAAASLALIRVYRFPLLMFNLCLALWFASMDLAPLLLGPEAPWEAFRRVSLACGIVYLIGAYALDRVTRKDYAFWLYLFGAAAFWGGLTLMDRGSEWSRLLYALINLGMILLSVSLGRSVLVLFGLLGFFGYLGDLAFRLFRDSLLFSFVLTALGLAFIGSGLLVRRWAPRIRARLDRASGGRLRGWIPRGRAGNPLTGDDE